MNEQTSAGEAIIAQFSLGTNVILVLGFVLFLANVAFLLRLTAPRETTEIREKLAYPNPLPWIAGSLVAVTLSLTAGLFVLNYLPRASAEVVRSGVFELSGRESGAWTMAKSCGRVQSFFFFVSVSAALAFLFSALVSRANEEDRMYRTTVADNNKAEGSGA
jgi:hypothetical protein